ncbi:hypothetical protein COT42_03030 [Candidatus Saganbacteria bacterium CG08_land_8_20_14_0_20_45_16]|uniref:Uncharacterized protein n=1 Tax=Candidatus Saganbacteria bacterium CG08_land_8_20_14_0_20_45_16 TaxID=2014293 RepID=A0A2H0XZD8_UNCSA|nr:MAG: hypothetical protein COT42_03030 [Candidatus Saganbacteria bacterium CG08_land_8_20_14_0_20_45_16]
MIQALNIGSNNNSSGLENTSLNGNNLLSQLEDRVNQALSQKDQPLGGSGGPAAPGLSHQQMANLISDIADKPMPGMKHNSVV